ncbi:hypothetical protein JCM17961_02720 [Endothiovibrio diazotrophicus]
MYRDGGDKSAGVAATSMEAEAAETEFDRLQTEYVNIQRVHENLARELARIADRISDQKRHPESQPTSGRIDFISTLEINDPKDLEKLRAQIRAKRDRMYALQRVVTGKREEMIFREKYGELENENADRIEAQANEQSTESTPDTNIIQKKYDNTIEKNGETEKQEHSPKTSERSQPNNTKISGHESDWPPSSKTLLWGVFVLLCIVLFGIYDNSMASLEGNGPIVAGMMWILPLAMLAAGVFSGRNPYPLGKLVVELIQVIFDGISKIRKPSNDNGNNKRGSHQDS